MSEVATNVDELRLIEDNVVIGAPSKMNMRVEFSGTGNILWLEDGVTLDSGSIRFPGDSAVVMLRRSRHPYHLDITAWSNTSFFCGKDTFFNGQLHVSLSEGCAVVLGDDCLLSFGIWIRTADPHLLYDATSHRRINYSRGVFVGDHVWIGQDAMLLKGTCMGSGSVLGAKAVISGKRMASNTVWAGNPARQVSAGLFWEGSSVHNWDEGRATEREVFAGNDYLYGPDESTQDVTVLLDELRGCSTAEGKLAYMQAKLMDTSGTHNRFCISEAGAKLTKRVTGAFRKIVRG